MTQPKTKYDKPILYELAAASFADHRTVERFLQGQPVKALTATRIRAACEMLGIALPAQAAEA